MRISLVEKDEAPHVVRRINDGIAKSLGTVPNFFKVLAHKPDMLRAFNQLDGAIWADGVLSPKLKDLAYLRTSIVNGCEY